MANTCCPEGYVYNVGRGICTNRTSPTAPPKDPIPCPTSECCPVGYTFVNEAGQFVGYGGVILTLSNPDITPFIGQCVSVSNSNWGILPDAPVDTVTCLCCPPGYQYVTLTGLCSSPTTKRDEPTIPCLDCNCVEPAVFECGTCTSDGVPISFSYNFTTRQCTDCCEDTPITPPCNMITFMPIQYADPNTTFKLLLLNYM